MHLFKRTFFSHFASFFFNGRIYFEVMITACDSHKHGWGPSPQHVCEFVEKRNKETMILLSKERDKAKCRQLDSVDRLLFDLIPPNQVLMNYFSRVVY